MARKPITKEIWKTLMKRWTVVSVIGFAIIFLTFWQMHGMKPGTVSKWLIGESVLGGLMALGGLFGLVLAFIFHLIHKDR
ncbi:MAG: hypothetical protein BMS9Abin18_0476 [Zetaproteobacteria bacterium]|nr:MAG: hypothetical protein BMS9Abin18_0476 [Zetaproteobacteria bacterium]